jgi:hypothetical protein
VNAFVIVEVEVGRETSACIIEGLIRGEIHVLILHRPPEPFCEDVVHAASTPIHTDPHVFREHKAREFMTRELDTLVGVPDLWDGQSKGIREHIETEARIKRRRQSPSHHKAGIPVEDGDKIAEASFKLDIGDIRSPDLVGTDDLKASKQIGVLSVTRVRIAQAPCSFGVDGFNPHLSHEATDMVTTDRDVMTSTKLDPHSARAIEGSIRVDPINEAHDAFVFFLHERDIREAAP